MITKMAHASFTVSDIRASLYFFVDLLGLETTPVMTVENDIVQRVIGIPGASLLISNVSLPDGNAIELIQYVTPKGKSLDLATQNPGVAHIAFEVTNLHAMVERLSSHGIKFVNPPVWDESIKMTVCYLRGPDDITFELMEKGA